MSETQERARGDLGASAKLVAKSAVRAAGVLAVYAAVGTFFHWTVFAFAAGDIWAASDGRGLAHAGPGPFAVFLLLLLLLTPQGFVTAIYVLGLPFLCLLLGKREAVRAAVHRLLRERAGELTELALGASMRVAQRLAATPGAIGAAMIARKLYGAIDELVSSRVARFLLRAIVRTLRLPQLLATTDFIARSKTDPEGARASLREALEPRIAALGGKASFKPLLYVCGATLGVTLLRGFWLRWLGM